MLCSAGLPMHKPIKLLPAAGAAVDYSTLLVVLVHPRW
jgi:hypothetical protein